MERNAHEAEIRSLREEITEQKSAFAAMLDAQKMEWEDER